MSVRTTMLSLCSLKISYVFKFKISITLLLFPKCRGSVVIALALAALQETFPTAKLTKKFENEGVTPKKFKVIFCEKEKMAAFVPKYLRNFGANKYYCRPIKNF